MVNYSHLTLIEFIQVLPLTFTTDQRLNNALAAQLSNKKLNWVAATVKYQSIKFQVDIHFLGKLIQVWLNQTLIRYGPSFMTCIFVSIVIIYLRIKLKSPNSSGSNSTSAEPIKSKSRRYKCYRMGLCKCRPM